jgi:DNA-binding transcriptional LysR family regulator
MNISKINLNLLVALDALLSEKNVTQAGKKIFITQSAMSSALAQLRQLFNDPLLIREGRVMKPTLKALALAPQIHEILQKIRLTVTPNDFDPKTANHTFRIGMSDYVEYVLLPKLLPLLDKYAPNIRLKIFHMNNLDKKEFFDEFQLDLAIGVIFNKAPESLSTELLFTDKSVCVADANNPLMKNKFTLKKYLEAKHMVILLPEEPYRSCIDKTLDKLGYKRNSVISIPHMIPGLFALVNTSLIVTTTTLIAHPIAKSLKLAVQKPPFKTEPLEVMQAWSKQLENSPSHIWLRGLVRQATKNLK